MTLNTRAGAISAMLVKADLDLMAAEAALSRIHEVDPTNALIGAGQAMVDVQRAIIDRLVALGKDSDIFDATWSEDLCVVEAYEYVKRAKR